MPTRTLHACQCQICQQDTQNPLRQQHAQMNLLFSRLDEQQRRWYAAVESQRIGHGGDKYLHQITGMDPETIARGRKEIAYELADRPTDKVRLPGGGRLPAEKKTIP